jgi:hypothetical protein
MRSPYLGHIDVDHVGKTVIWRMSARDARNLADALSENISAADLAHQDADALREAADTVDPRDEESATVAAVARGHAALFPTDAGTWGEALGVDEGPAFFQTPEDQA